MIAPATVATPIASTAMIARGGGLPLASMMLPRETPVGTLCSRIPVKISTPRLVLSRNPPAIATPSKNEWGSNPTSAQTPMPRDTIASACVSTPKWKCGVSECCVRCTTRYPASTAMRPPRTSIACGNMPRITTASMNPAPKPVSVASARRSPPARQTTSRPPARSPSAASAANSAPIKWAVPVRAAVPSQLLRHRARHLEQPLALVERRVLDHDIEQRAQDLAELRTGFQSELFQVVAVDREIAGPERRLRREHAPRVPPALDQVALAAR